MNWKQALALGLCSVGAYAKKEPIGYEYGSINDVLPPLPEWDKETYPYAYVYLWSAISGNYLLILSSTPAVPTENYGGSVWDCYYPYLVFSAFPSDSAWEQCDLDYDRQLVGYTTSSGGQWCNTDMLFTDGTVFCKASDPIPVYE